MNISAAKGALAAGLLISIGCKVMTTTGGIFGSLLFAIALLTILSYGLPLFTGKVAYTWSPQLLFILLFNAIGALLGNFIFSSGIPEVQLVTRFSYPSWVLFGKAFGCGALMYIAVDCKDRPYMTAMAVMAFILCGFEHCIADFAYIGIVHLQETALSMLVIIAGNAAGAKIVRWLIGWDRNPPLPGGNQGSLISTPKELRCKS